ncbi:MAG: cupin domain-containing protein [Candidatus Altiarchaeia archaeon]
MKELLKEVGSRIRELRELSGVSVKEMALHLSMPADAYKSFEDGSADIPASALFSIAQKLKVDMGLLLTGEETRMHIFTVTRAGKGVEIERRKQYKYQTLGEKFINKKAETFLVTVEPKKQKPQTNSHPGQEFDYVLNGSLKFYIHDNVLILKEGDSVYFDSSYPHAMEALDNKNASFLAVII